MLYRRYIKRAIDITLSALGLIALIPLFLLVAVLIKREDRGSVFFRQVRVGQGGKLFRIYKFRTMVENAEKLGVQVTKGDDPRVTRIGKFLRKYKIDELPQLINVLKGDMSLVGPRPEVPKYVEAYREDYEEILKVKPGITDYASLEYIREEEILKETSNPEETYIKEILPQKIELYKRYVRELSFKTDMAILFKTIIRIFS